MNSKKVLASLLGASLLTGSIGGLSMSAGAEMVGETQHLRTWYTAPATDWEQEALPIGNGFIGGMVFGGVESDHIQVNEHTVWSGGPGAKSSYNYGISTKSADSKAAINELRQALQDLASDFTATKKAYKTENGRVVSYNYSYGDRANEIAQLQKPLYGSREVFGYYQTLGDIYINDTAATTPLLLAATSNYEPSGGEGEAASNLFDNNLGSKWFAGNAGKSLEFPVVVSWEYSQPYTFNSYKISSANDMDGRDPKKWTLYGSNDGENFTAIDTRENVTFSGRQTTNEYTLSDSVSYRYFRFEIQSTKSNMPPQLSEINLVEQRSTLSYDRYTRWLDLNTATAGVSYESEGVTYTREYFTSNPDNVMAIRLTASQAGALSRQIMLTSEQPRKVISAAGDTITMTGRPSDHTTNGLKFAEQVKIIPTGGTMTVEGNAIRVENADEILILMAAATNYVQVQDTSKEYFSNTDPQDTTAARIAAAATKGYDDLLAAHEADYKELFDRVTLNLGGFGSAKDTASLLAGYKNGGNSAEENRYLEMLYYQFGRYLLIASSREGSLPANLQGIWATGLNPPWNCDYHTNINVQMNYWPAEQTNLSECHMPLIDYINAQVAVGEVYASYYYATPEGGDVRGWALPCGNNIWNHIGSNDTEIGLVPSGAAWLCQHIWEHYAFTKDEQFLADNFDTMLGAALFWVDNLWTDERDGKLVVNPSYSPEHGGLSLGTTYDQSIVWEIFTNVLAAAEVLGDTRSELDEIRQSLSQLSTPLQIGLGGQLMEWKDETTMDINGDGGHRHVNHLYALHPGNQVVAGRSEWDDEMVEAMKKTLNTRGDGGTGWSMAWKINFWARLRDGNHAQRMVGNILKNGTYANLFDTHPPFQIDGNFGATAGMTEMLLQSQGNSIDLLPSLPTVWENGYVTGLKARGNFTVDMGWAEGALTDAVITSVVGGDCAVKFNGVEDATILNAAGEEVPTTQNEDGSVTFATEAGGVYTVSMANAPRPDEGKLGDVNGSDTVDTTDARLVLQYAANKIGEEEIDLTLGDVDGSGSVDTTDARLILQYSAEKIDKFPAEE